MESRPGLAEVVGQVPDGGDPRRLEDERPDFGQRRRMTGGAPDDGRAQEEQQVRNVDEDDPAHQGGARAEPVPPPWTELPPDGHDHGQREGRDHRVRGQREAEDQPEDRGPRRPQLAIRAQERGRREHAGVAGEVPGQPRPEELVRGGGDPGHQDREQHRPFVQHPRDRVGEARAGPGSPGGPWPRWRDAGRRPAAPEGPRRTRRRWPRSAGPGSRTAGSRRASGRYAAAREPRKGTAARRARRARGRCGRSGRRAGRGRRRREGCGRRAPWSVKGYRNSSCSVRAFDRRPRRPD